MERSDVASGRRAAEPGASCAYWPVALLGEPCVRGRRPLHPELEDALSPTAAAYLNDALDIMEAHSVRRYEIDWEVLREYAFRTAAGALTAEDT